MPADALGQPGFWRDTHPKTGCPGRHLLGLFGPAIPLWFGSVIREQLIKTQKQRWWQRAVAVKAAVV